MSIEIYTYFGRVARRIPMPDSETHHGPLEEARATLSRLEKETGNPHWIRFVGKGVSA